MDGLVLMLALIASVTGTALAGYGPPTEVPPNPSFIAAYSPVIGLIQLGTIASRRYVILNGAAAGAPHMFEYRFGDLNGPTITFLPGALRGAMPFAIMKTCQIPSGYKAIPFAATDVPDYTKNNTGLIYYFKMSEKKYYTRTAEVVQDDLCDEVTGSDDGDSVYGCLDAESGTTDCESSLDTINGQAYSIMVYIIVNGIPVGEQYYPVCRPGDTELQAPLFFYKLQGFRDVMLSLIDFENQ